MATITKRGDRQWQVKVRRKTIATSATFETKARAEAWARQIESEIDAGRFQHGRVEADRTLLNEALERYLVEIVPRKKGIKQNTGVIRAWQRTPLARKPLSSIRGADLAAWRDEKLKEVGPQTVVHHLNLLSHVYTVAGTEWGLETLQNPVSRIKKPNLPRGRDRRLTDDEQIQLLAACDSSESRWLGAMVRLALATAMRQGELVGLTWQHVNLTNRTILLRDTKNGETRTVPLSSAAVQVLEGLPKSASGPIFEIQTGRAVSHAFTKACCAAEMTNLHFHDLRHEATSRLFEQTDLRDIEIAAITGHKTMEMLKRYAHLRAGKLAMRLG
ncbi:tyrosine-type recombinase/integrase [Azospirillum ramasamyi]|uniref:Site-specific integrase n=1 Tax=Azospirillum ramasamyi TaxID=682998 RepID=A0A2U9S5I9_9PROT|nr:tyrosine-type recombinase/integrase [Azospirillum ramasamyi]AWU94830.1 site-specific integrase [Azospirillum ramasamyi]